LTTWRWPASPPTCSRRTTRAGRPTGRRPALTIPAVTAAAGLLTLGSVACGAPQPVPGSGDPGERHLHQLRADPVFAAVPPEGAIGRSIVEHRASFRKAGLDGGGWSGPTVTLTFISNRASTSVYDFYAAVARASGWRARAEGARNLTDSWTKTYPDGSPASLSLTDAPATAGRLRYTLNASSPPTSH
jgi:hypothetical protein